MGSAGGQVGPRGLAVLAATAVVATALAVHGWTGRRSGLAPGALSGPGPARTAPARSPVPARPSTPTPAGSRPADRPGTPAASPAAGPQLSSEPYAQYSYLIWPGTPDATAHTALTGLSITVRRHGTGLSVAAGVIGQPVAPHFYQRGARVYVVEASLGDDSGSSDYNLGDDGLVVTDTQGRVLS